MQLFSILFEIKLVVFHISNKENKCSVDYFLIYSNENLQLLNLSTRYKGNY